MKSCDRDTYRNMDNILKYFCLLTNFSEVENE